MVNKKEFIWNTIASIVTSAVSVVLLLVCTRVNGTDVAGIFAITFAASMTLNAIGDYGIRVYQVTDSKRKYKFGEYLTMRWTVIIAMVIVSIIYMLISGYNTEKFLICLFLVLYRVVENLSEVYQGELQLNGKLDIAGKSIIYRNVASMFMFAVVDYFTKNLVFATAVMFITNAVIIFFYDIKIIKEYQENKLIIKVKNLIHMLKDCLPVCISTVMNLYISNSPKYAIDKAGTYEMQTIFNIIYLPTFTINLASLFILKPIMKTMASLWNEDKIKDFFKLLLKMFGVISVVTLFIEIICATIGLPILKWIYGVDVLSYTKEVSILVLSGGFFAFSVVLFYALTTMRAQNKVMIGYVLTSIFAYFVAYEGVKKYALFGASVTNLMVTMFLFIVLLIVTVVEVKILKKKKKIKNTK